jgi:hypothetical protein
MFAYFGDQPWIHLRKSKAAIAKRGMASGVDQRIAVDLGLPIKDYVRQMLSVHHINGLTLPEYDLERFCARTDVRVVKYNVSKEGESLLTDDLLAELAHVPKQQLTEHGFELLFQRIA